MSKAVYIDDVLSVLCHYAKYDRTQLCEAIAHDVARLPDAEIPVTINHKAVSGINWVKEN